MWLAGSLHEAAVATASRRGSLGKIEQVDEIRHVMPSVGFQEGSSHVLNAPEPALQVGAVVVRGKGNRRAPCRRAFGNVCVQSSGFEQNVHRKLSSVRKRFEQKLLSTYPSCMSACLTRYDSPRNWTSRPWCTTRSMTAAAIWSSPKTPPQRENSRLVVMTTLCLS